MVSRPRSLAALRRRDRPVIVNVEALHRLNGFLLGHPRIAIGLELGFAFAIGVSGIMEDTKKLFALRNKGSEYTRHSSARHYMTHRAHDLAGLVNHGHGLAERSHSDSGGGRVTGLVFATNAVEFSGRRRE